MALADALELLGTFGIPPDRTPVLLAGGAAALIEMTGAVEDIATDATRDVADAGLGAGDVVICVSASGTTPYTLAAAEAARAAGATVVGIANVAGSALLQAADLPVLLDTGPELVAGSTRMGAATAQKIALNMLSTLTGLRLGHVHDGYMVNVVADNAKLRRRAARIVAAVVRGWRGRGRRRDRGGAAARSSRRCSLRPAPATAAARTACWRRAADISDRRSMRSAPSARSNADRAPGRASETRETHLMPLQSLKAVLFGSTLLAGGAAFAQDVNLTIESWRNDDLPIWQDNIIPAFEAAHPGIKVTFAPSAPTEYNAALNSKLDAGSAGDLITCRPFDASLELYNKGQLADLTEPRRDGELLRRREVRLVHRRRLSHLLRADGLVIHGFIYNKAAFDELGLTAPTTEAEFFAALDKIKADGTYIPMAMGTNDQWEAATMGYQNIGPNYWKGEEGRLALIDGSQKLTDPQWVAPYTELARWKDYLGDGFEAQTYPDSQNLFTLGRAAIYPAGSWEIAPFESQIQGAFEMGAFPPPVADAGDELLHLRPRRHRASGSTPPRRTPTRRRPSSSGSARPSSPQLYANALPGFFPLSNAAGDARGSAGAGVRLLAREVPLHDPLDLPDPLARHAQPRERDLERLGQRHPRHRHPRSRGTAAAGGPCQLVRAAAEMNHRPRPHQGGAAPTGSVPMADRRPFRWHIPIFLAPAVLVYTAVMIIPLFATLNLALFAPRRRRRRPSSASTTSAPSSAIRAGRRASGTRSATTSGSSSSTCWCRTRSASFSPPSCPRRACGSPPSTARRSSCRPSSPSSSSASSGS